jgi:hypothetical protein
MTSPEQRALLRQRDLLAARLAQGLVDEAPLTELQALQSRLQLIESLVAGRAGRGRALKRHGIAFVVVAAIVTLAAWTPIPRVPFSIELEADSAQLLMPDSGGLEGQAVGAEFRAEGFTTLESADAGLMRRAKADGSSPIALRAERLNLKRILYAAGTSLGFEGGAPAVFLSLEGAAHTVEFELGGKVATSFGGAPSENSSYPVAEWIKLRGEAGSTELWLARGSGGLYRWRGLRPAMVRLVERQAGADAQVRLQSALHHATLRLPATEREVQLASGSSLELDGLAIEQSELVLGDAVALKLSGSARHIGVQTGGFAQSLEPSWLDYAAHNHGLGLLWSAAGLLWGISTWLRKQFGDAV